MDVVERLMALGFSLHEARVYVALLRQPSATGYELARTTGLPRANVYQTLATLVARDVIQLVSDNPARYVAHPPSDVLGRIKRETAVRCDALVADLATLAPPPDLPAFWTIRGREAIVERVSAQIAEATSRVAICLWSDDLEWARAPLREAARSGCEIVVNLFGDAPLEFGDVYRHEDPAKVVGGHLLTLAVDSATALVAALDEPAAAVYTQHPALVRLVEKLIRDEAYLAAIYERFHDLLEATYGPHLIALRQRLLPRDQAERLISVVGFGAAAVATDGEILEGD